VATVLTNKHKIPFEIDDEDLEKVSLFSWYIDSKGYARTGIWDPRTQNNTSFYLHQLLKGESPHGMRWDHEDRNKLNNHKSNIRLVTYGGNMRNRNARSDNTSGYPGVSVWPKGYVAYIQVNGKGIRLGTFKTLEEAAQARLAAEKKYWL
jgi:hypothetical protein